MTPNIVITYHRLNQKIENQFNSNLGLIKLSIMLYICFSFLYFPEIITKRAINSWSVQDHNIQSFVNEKIKQPFKPIQRLEIGEHLSKRELRLSPYLIGKVLHLEAVKLFYLQAIVFLPLFIFFCLKTIHQLSKDHVIAFYGTIALLASYVGNSFNYDTYFFDSFAYLGLIAAVYYRNHWSLIPILLVTYFVDERSVVPSTAIFIISNLNESNQLPRGFINAILRNRTFWQIACAILVYCTIRLFLFLHFELNTPIGQGSGIRLFTALRFKFKVPGALFSAIKLNLLLVYLACVQLFKTKNGILAYAFSIMLSIILLVSTAVEDVTRSLAYAFPLLFIYYAFISQDANELKNKRLFICLIAVINLLLPTYTLLLKLYQIPLFGWINLFFS